MIKRLINPADYLKPQKAVIILGPRRAGKTTLLNECLRETSFRFKLDTGDNIRLRALFEKGDMSEILAYAENYDLLAIDEAQEIPEIGRGLKILTDHSPGLRIIVTGSSSFDLVQKVGEPLTGRKRSLILYPVSQQELLSVHNRYELREKLDEFMIFGSYPEVISAPSRSEKIEILTELVNSYLLKDVLALGDIRAPGELLNLVKLIAFQTGSEVSLNELASQLKIDVKTVERYLDILEKGFVIKRLSSFSRNLRKEISKKSKYYFLDNGIRNAVIMQFNNPELRNDMGQLFENFMVMERIKYQSYNGVYGNIYFRRTYDKKEIDFIEERDGKLFAYEFKYSPDKKVKKPSEFLTEYPGSEFKVINSENYQEFVT